MHNGDLAGILILGFIGSVISWVVWVISTNARRRQALRDIVDLQTKLLDRCVASGELQRYLESDPGRKLLESASEGAMPVSGILGALRGGIVLCLFGIVNLSIRTVESNADVREVLFILASGALAIGAGLLLSAMVSYLLSRSWGLMKRP
jgi:hypothetical protein